MWLQELNLTQSSSLGRQIEVLTAFAPVANGSLGRQQPFSVGMQLSTGHGTFTQITVNGTAAASAKGTLTISQVSLQSPLVCLIFHSVLQLMLQIICRKRQPAVHILWPVCQL